MDEPLPSKASPLQRSLLWLVLLGGFGCCMMKDCQEQFATLPPLLSSPMDLGTVQVPPGTLPDTAQHYTWRVQSLEPSWYQVRFGLSALLASEIELEDKALARRLHFKPLANQSFNFQPPDGCEDDMSCIYGALSQLHPEPVEQLGAHFLALIHSQGLNPAQAAELILGFVQRIHYELPGPQVPFGVIPPALVPARNAGDCDSKALLAVMLLRQAGIDAVILYSEALQHAAVGLGLPGGGSAIKKGGRSWRYVEITAEGWTAGMMPPQYDKPHLWMAVPLKIPK